MTSLHSHDSSRPNETRPFVKRPSFIISLAALAALTATAVDIALPAQPLVAESFGERAAAGGVIVSAYLLGYGPGQMVWGPLADKYGRIPPLMIGLVGFILATIACIFASDLETLSVYRFVQGIFGGSSPVIARAIARDQGGGKETAKLLTTIMMIFGVAPLMAPMVGGGILLLTDWTGTFWFLVAFASTLILLTRLFIMPATRAHAETAPPRKPLTWSLIGRLFSARDFLMGTLAMSAIFGGYASMLSIGAVMTNTRYGITPTEFGPLFAMAAAAIIIGPALTRYIISKYSLRTPLKVGAACAGVTGLAFLFMAHTWVPLAVYWVFVFLYILSFGLVMPVANALALEPAGDAAGTASSLLSALPTMGAAAGSALAASPLFGSDSYYALSISMAGGGILTCLLIMVWDTSHRRGNPNNREES